MKILFLILPYLNFYSAVEKYYRLSILLKIFIGAAKITHKESFKDNHCSIAI